MNKNSIIGIILIGVILIGFSYLNRPKKTTQGIDTAVSAEESVRADSSASSADNLSLLAHAEKDSVAFEQVLDPFEQFQREAQERVITLQNNKLLLELSSLGAMPQSVRLKEYVRLKKDDKDEPLYLFKKGAASQNFELRAVRGNLDTRDLYFDVVSASDSTAIMRLPLGDDAYLDFTYTLRNDDYRLTLDISGKNLHKVFPSNMSLLDIQMEQNLSQLEKSWENENTYSSLYYKYLSGDVDHLSEGKRSHSKENIQQSLHWIAFKNKFFATVVVADEDKPFRRSSLTHTTYPKEHEFLKKMIAKTEVDFDNRAGGTVRLNYLYVPLAYKHLKSYDADRQDANAKLELQRLVNVGGSFLRWINLTLILPIVEWLKTWISNWGLIILVLTIIIKVVLSPLTFKSYLSQAKMKVLKPQVEAINAKFPGNDQATQMKRTQETMALYKSAGASPMAGCLPMLLQMPFLIALFRFFPTSIDLRGTSFLWAEDLSSYDPILSWSYNLPLIGDHISGFCLLWAIVNILYSKYTMSQASTGQAGQMQMMKWMPIIMSVMFFFFFNNNSSGLCYYYLISILITMIQFLMSRLLINEEKLLAKLEENKKKPRKPSGFMARLAEAQKQQEKYMREQQKRRR